MSERRMKLRLGLFVAGALAVLAGLVILFGGRPHIFSSKAKYTVQFPEAPGVGVGTPIRKSGVPIGEVTALDLDPETGLVRVGIAVDPKFSPRRNEDATITRGLLSGDTAIDFLPKIGPDGLPTDRGQPLPPGSTIEGVPPVTARSLLTPASSAAARRRRCKAFSAAASSARELMPRNSASSPSSAMAVWPAARAIATTSVR